MQVHWSRRHECDPQVVCARAAFVLVVDDTVCSNDDMVGIWATVPDVAKFDAGSLGPDGTGVGACM